MSLDVYLTMPEAKPRSGSGIFVRVDGSVEEVSREEYARMFPGREPVVVEQEYDTGEVFDANITHNLGKMAAEAGIYEALWRPAEMDPERAARIREQEAAGNYHGPTGAYAIEGEAVIHAHDLIEPLRAGLALMESDPERFKAHNPENGWGSYDDFVPWVRKYLEACEEYPDAIVRVSR
jgi:hypothetical protein